MALSSRLDALGFGENSPFDMTNRLHSVELRLQHLENRAREGDAAERRRMEEERARITARSNQWEGAFKALAVLQIVFVIGLVIYRAYRP